ncbi:MAG: hypothetical protein ACE5I4_03155 [Thermoplasmata archaeon]
MGAPEVSSGSGKVWARSAGSLAIVGAVVLLASLPLSVYPTSIAAMEAEVEAQGTVSPWNTLAPFIATNVVAGAAFVAIILGYRIRRQGMGATLGLTLTAILAFIAGFAFDAGFLAMIAGGLFFLAGAVSE